MFNKISTQPKDQSTHFSMAALNTLLKQYPFKDLSGLPSYVPIECERALLAMYTNYLVLLQRFVAEKEDNNLAFSSLSSVDQKKEAWHPTTGSKDDGRKRICYASSRLALELIYPDLRDAALALQSFLSAPGEYSQLHGYEDLSLRRQLLHRANRIAAAALLGYFVDVQDWLSKVHSRPAHIDNISGGNLVLSLNAIDLICAGGKDLIMRRYSSDT